MNADDAVVASRRRGNLLGFLVSLGTASAKIRVRFEIRIRRGGFALHIAKMLNEMHQTKFTRRNQAFFEGNC